MVVGMARVTSTRGVGVRLTVVFKVNPSLTTTRLFDLHGFAEYGKEGVLALLQDSTNVERKGYTPSERAVHRKFEERSEEHTSELQSPDHLVCRLLLEKKKKALDTALRSHRTRFT